MTTPTQNVFIRHRAWLLITGIAILTTPSLALDTPVWLEIKSQHFLVLHTGDQAFAEKVSLQAEHFYQSITTTLGFTRFKGFWLWGNRARIIIYPSAKDFRMESNAPAWAIGRASASRHEIAGSRDDEEHFLKSVLPHEMTHLILAEFIGAERLPHWLAEGVAQWEQTGRKQALLISREPEFIPLETLLTIDIRKENRPEYAKLYYAECASLVSFLITQHGSDNFGRFCRALRDGKSAVEALSSIYPGIASSLTTLESTWLGAQKTSK